MNKEMANYESIVFDTKILGYITDIVDEGSLTKAAEKNYLSQPALSRYLHEVEKSIGVSIFEKRHNRLELTKEGILFINGARSMVHFEKEALDKINPAVENHDRIIRLAAPHILKQPLHRLALKWNAEHPESVMTAVYENADVIKERTAGGECDFGIILSDGEDHPLLSGVALQESTPVLILSGEARSLLGRKSDQIALQDLRYERFMLCTHDSCLRRMQENILAEAGIPEPAIAASGDVDLLWQLAIDGKANVILPSEYAASIDPSRTVKLSYLAGVHYSLIWSSQKKPAYLNDFLPFFREFWKH